MKARKMRESERIETYNSNLWMFLQKQYPVQGNCFYDRMKSNYKNKGDVKLRRMT